MTSHFSKRPFRKGTGIPQHIPPLRPQTAKQRAQKDIIIEEKPSTGFKPQPQRPPTVIRNKAPSRNAGSRIDAGPTPRKTPTTTSNLPSKRPTTAQPVRQPHGIVNSYKSKQNQIQDVNLSSDIDYELQCAQVRDEIAKEFGITLDEKDAEQPWIDDLSSLQDQLNENIYQTSIIDENPVTIMDQVSNEMMNSNSDQIDPFKDASNMLDESFSKFQQMMDEEKKLLDDRIALLQKCGHDLMLHPASDYTADTEPDDIDDIMQKPQPIIIQTKARPGTARTRNNGNF